MSAIDVHTHAFPDGVAERAMAKMQALCPWKAFGGGTVGNLVKSMDAADIDVSVVCAVATRPDQVKGIMKWCDKVRSDRIEPFPSVHPDTRGAAKWVERIAKAGFTGIKLHPLYQGFAVDDGCADAIYAAAAEHELAVVVHCGLDFAFPADDDRASVERIRRVVDRFGELKMICTHMGGWRSWDAVEEHLLGADVYMETSFGVPIPVGGIGECKGNHTRIEVRYVWTLCQSG